jgi:hypothetical protein
MAEFESVPSGRTARVADSYGTDPSQHKPSQDPWAADTAEHKQAETGGAPWVGTNSWPTGSSGNSSNARTGGASTPAPTTANRSSQGRTANRSAGSTATGRKAPSRKGGS